STLALAERDCSSDPVRPVFGHFDRGLAVLVGRFAAVDGVAERAGGAGFGGADDVVRLSAGWFDEGLLANPKHRRQPVSADARVGARSPIVEDGELFARVAVQPVGHTLGILFVNEVDSGVGTVAERLHIGATASTECHLRARWDPIASPVD